ncbi:tumor necrosis factor ligand superfamily member 12-like isoform X1 [Apteryx mantelli]|uniref:Tumor necrosis factor ligand superfamily member 12-like isoform X1 n=1 Tax=Apteryx mantelli TaxID=2696672 RepID=A0ABM4G7T9_9AVES
MQTPCKRCANTMQTLCKPCANSMQTLCKRYANAVQTPCKPCANPVQTPCKRCANTMQTLCKRRANAVQTPCKRCANSVQTLCKRLTNPVQKPGANPTSTARPGGPRRPGGGGGRARTPGSRGGHGPVSPQALLQGGASALEPPGLLPRGLSQEQPRPPRHRRAAPRKRPRSRKAAAAPAWAAHYEVQAGASRDGILAEADGTIRGWAESRLNATSPLSYDPASGGFRVARPGLYYLYSQAHFDEAGTAYLKLEVAVGGALALRCLEQLPPPRPGDAGARLRGCRLGGLLALPPAAPLALRTLPRVRLKPEPYLTYFGLFQVR